MDENGTWCSWVDPGYFPMGKIGAAYLITFGVSNFVFYISVLVVLLTQREAFNNPFHRFVVALGVIDMYDLLYLNIYVPISSMNGNPALGDSVDHMFSSIFYVCTYASHQFQTLIAVNRFCAVVLFSRYKRIFTLKNAKFWIAACYSFGIFFVGVTLPFGYAYTNLKWGGPYFPFSYDPTSLLYLWPKRFELGVLTAPVLLAQMILYPIAFAFVRKRAKTVTVANRSALSIEIKLLIIGAFQAVVFTFGYFQNDFLVCYLPGWVHFHLWVAYVPISPYLYLIFDRNIRKHWVKQYFDKDISSRS